MGVRAAGLEKPLLIRLLDSGFDAQSRRFAKINRIARGL